MVGLVRWKVKRRPPRVLDTLVSRFYSSSSATELEPDAKLRPAKKPSVASPQQTRLGGKANPADAVVSIDSTDHSYSIQNSEEIKWHQDAISRNHRFR